MAEVTVTINSRQFRMACEDGQEEHLAQLAQKLDARIAALRDKFGEIGDARLTVMAALVMADELLDLTGRLREMEKQLATVQSAQGAAADRVNANQAAVVEALSSAAERIESVARKLNQNPGGSGVAMG